jgi:hypothetical protein
MQLQWLVLASGLFVTFALMLPGHSRLSRTIRWLVFAGMAYGFALGAYQMHGPRGLVSFGYLMYATFGAALLGGDVRSPNRAFVVAETLVRWVGSLVLFFPLVVAFDLGRGSISGWETKPRVVPFGAIYFAGLTLLEVLVYPHLLRVLRPALGRSCGAA